jgi:hypothetical protein
MSGRVMIKRNQRNWVVQVDNFNKLSLIGHFSVFVKFFFFFLYELVF